MVELNIAMSISSICINGKDVPINNVEQLRDILGTVNWWMNFGHVLPQSVSNGVSTQPIPHILKPPVGERAIDYMVKAASGLGEKFSVRNLYDAMLAAGWPTKSKRASIAIAQVRQLLKSDKRFSSSGDGYWSYIKGK